MSRSLAASLVCVAVLLPGCTGNDSTMDLSASDDMAIPDLATTAIEDFSLTPDLSILVVDLANSDALLLCSPGSYQSCAAGTAVYCNGDGTAVVEVDCGAAGCVAPGSCGQCTPNTQVCTGGGMQTMCDAFGRA